jgi:hypothetical protein
MRVATFILIAALVAPAARTPDADWSEATFKLQ